MAVAYRSGLVLAHAGLAVAGLALVGCTSSGADALKVTPAVPAAYAQDPASANRPAITPQTQWWTAFGDPVLNRLVEDALAQNLDVAEARERIEAARLAARINGSDVLPAIDAEAEARTSGTRTKGRTQTTNTASLGLTGSWIFNPVGAKAQKRADAARVALAQEDLNQARLDLVADMAQAWLDARAAGRQLAIAERTLSVQRRTASITAQRQEAGAASALDTARARASVASTSADIPELVQARQQALHRVALLIGKTPSELGRMDLKPLSRPRAAVIGAGVPADLIRNRPDVRTAEQVLELALADIGLAEAQLLPTLSLSGSITVSGTKAATTAWSFGPSITLPLFDRGRLYDGVDLATSSARADYIAWKQSVISAVTEVESALVAWQQEQIRRNRLANAVSEYRTAADLARQLFEAGSVSFDPVLDAESALYQAERQLAISDATLAGDIIRIAKALGGGWAPKTGS